VSVRIAAETNFVALQLGKFLFEFTCRPDASTLTEMAYVLTNLLVLPSIDRIRSAVLCLNSDER
jgi:hypothetical protein